jgi:ankyrin repeat protein
MEAIDWIGDVFKKISDVEHIILFEACNDGDKPGLWEWLNDPKNQNRREAAFKMTNTDGQTLLHAAATYGRVHIVEDLVPLYIEAGIELNTLFDNYHDTPFTCACSRGYAKVIGESLRVNRDGYERTDRYYILLKFLDCGVKIDMKDVIKRKKNSPLHWAIYYGDYASAMLAYLMEPLQVFYRNDQKKLPFDIVWNFVVSREKEKFRDGLWIIDNLLPSVKKYLESLLAKSQERHPGDIGASINIAKDWFESKGGAFISGGKNFMDTVGMVVGITEEKLGESNFDDRSNILLKGSGVQLQELQKHFEKSIIEDPIKNLPSPARNSGDPPKNLILQTSDAAPDYQNTNDPELDVPFQDYRENPQLTNSDAKLIFMTVRMSPMCSKGVRCSLSTDQDAILGINKTLAGRLDLRRKKLVADVQSKKFNETIEIVDHKRASHLQSWNIVLEQIFFWVCFLERYDDIHWYMQTFQMTPFYNTEFNDFTCIHMAASYGKIHLLRFLVEFRYTWTSGHIYSISELLNIATERQVFTPLHEAVANQESLVIEYIIKKVGHDKAYSKAGQGHFALEGKPNQVHDDSNPEVSGLSPKNARALAGSISEMTHGVSPYYFLFNKFSYRGVLP